MQAVFLSNGGTYVGHLNFQSPVSTLTNGYLIVPPNASSTQYSIQKLSNNQFGLSDTLNINSLDIQSYQELIPNGQLANAIASSTK